MHCYMYMQGILQTTHTYTHNTQTQTHNLYKYVATHTTQQTLHMFVHTHKLVNNICKHSIHMHTGIIYVLYYLGQLK